MQKWEYKWDRSTDDIRRLDLAMNLLTEMEGNHGWELVSVVYLPKEEGFYYFFKRPKS
jgi:hypothetical protein